MVLQQHYWKSKPHKPAFHWCLPSTLWPRGYWARPPSCQPSSGPKAVLRNTFIDVEVDECRETMSTMRKSRSASPLRRKESECCDEFLTWALNGTHVDLKAL